MSMVSEPNEFRSVKFCLMLGVFFSLFLWGIWTRGVLALGINATIFLGLGLWGFIRGQAAPDRFALKSWIPILLVILSYSLFENPFIKNCHFIFLPIAIGITALSVHPEALNALFSTSVFLIGRILNSTLGVLPAIPCSAVSHWRLVRSLTSGMREGLNRPSNSKSFRSVLRGVGILAALSILIVIPLLSAADQIFAARLSEFYDAVQSTIKWIFKQEIVTRTGGVVIVSLLSLSLAIAWSIVPSDKAVKHEDRDSISAGVVIGGILLIYLVFLGIQIERLWTGALPIEFSETEAYVKNGFWQLIALALLNILLVLNYFRRTVPAVQHLLSCFVAASMLLLFSAAQRMHLYVSFYGLSYEKFYASYTVLYCILLFALILAAQIRKDQAFNMLRQTVLLLMWMYGLVSVFPTEQLIVRFNIAQSLQADSRIKIRELKILSIDALPYISAHQSELLKPSRNGGAWTNVGLWTNEKRLALDSKKWFEQSFSSLFAANTP